MQFSLYDTKQKSLQAIDSERQPTLKIYSCGPTVYNIAHIGNLRSYIFSDVLRRTLKLAGFTVEMAMNITDVDDKTIKGAYEIALQKGQEKASHGDLKNFTEKYSQLFFADLDKIGIEKVEHYPRATDHIDEMVDLVQRLIDKGFAYTQDGSIYMAIDKVKDYGVLSHIDLDSVKTGLRYNTDEYGKDDIRDFVLWKGEKENDISWQTSIGKGRPGWHLECSAMIQSIFGECIDIHTGGIDLVFPHHENESAQSNCAYEHSFVKNWMHCEHLLVDNKKMSKSLNNFYTLEDIEKKGFKPVFLRYLLLSVHYKQKLNFTLESLEQCEKTVTRIWNSFKKVNLAEDNLQLLSQNEKANFESLKITFLGQLCNNLNVSGALGTFHDFMSLANQHCDKGISAIDKEYLIEQYNFFDQLINVLKFMPTELNATNSHADLLLTKRNQARKNKDFVTADKLRDDLLGLGFKIIDTKLSSVLEKA